MRVAHRGDQSEPQAWWDDFAASGYTIAQVEVAGYAIGDLVPGQDDGQRREASESERLDWDLANKGKPRRHVFVALCQPRKHALLWVVRLDGRLVPVAKAAGGPIKGYGFPGVVDQDGQPSDLRRWPRGREVPIGECGCGVRTGYQPHELLERVASGTKREFIHRH